MGAGVGLAVAVGVWVGVRAGVGASGTGVAVLVATGVSAVGCADVGPVPGDGARREEQAAKARPATIAITVQSTNLREIRTTQLSTDLSDLSTQHP
jgi:hypothetical protein